MIVTINGRTYDPATDPSLELRFTATAGWQLWRHPVGAAALYAPHPGRPSSLLGTPDQGPSTTKEEPSCPIS